MSIRYRPTNKIFIDTIPVFVDGTYHIFYLQGYSDDSGWPRGQTSWAHLTSENLIVWQEEKVAIVPGLNSDRDGFACFTGSVITKDGLWHIFYTGFNPGHPEGREVIMHATSKDGVLFEKDSKNPVLSIDKEFYGSGEDWRDPFVFWNEEEQCYWMTITAGMAEPISGIKRGVIGLAKSKELENWIVFKPIFCPNNYPSMECSDVFKIGDWWYLLFSQYGHTEYRMAKSSNGPWLRPANPLLDGGDGFFYAAKTLFDGKRRLLFGWCGSLEGGKDRDCGQWGGDLVSPRELDQSTCGELRVKCPNEMEMMYSSIKLKFEPVCGRWDFSERNIDSSFCEGLSACLFTESLNNIMIKMTISTNHSTGKAGIILNADSALSQYYYISIDIGLGIIEVLRCNSMNSVYGALQNGIKRIANQIIPGNTSKNEWELIAFFGDDILEVFIDQKISVTTRLIDIKNGRFGLFTEDLAVRFDNVFVGQKLNKQKEMFI